MTGTDGEPVEFYSKFSDLLPDSWIVGPQLAVTDVTSPAACSNIACAVQMSGFCLGSN